MLQLDEYGEVFNFRLRDSQVAHSLAGTSTMSLATPGYGSTDNVPPNYRHTIGKDRSLFAKFRQAKEESNGSILQMILYVINYFLSSAVFLIILFIIICVPIAMIVMGSIYINDCPLSRAIPVLLIVGGAVIFVNNIVNLSARWRKLRPEEAYHTTKFTILGAVTSGLNCVAIAIFIAGCVIIYGNLWPSPSTTDIKYCHPILFHFAFWLYTSAFIFMGFLFCIGFIGLLASIFCC